MKKVMKKVLILSMLMLVFILGGCLKTSTEETKNEKSNIEQSKFKEIINLMLIAESKKGTTGNVLNGIFVEDLEANELLYYPVTYLATVSANKATEIIGNMYKAELKTKVGCFVLSGKALTYTGLTSYSGIASFNIPVENFIDVKDKVKNVDTGEIKNADGTEISNDEKVVLSSTASVVNGLETFEIKVAGVNFNENGSGVEFSIDYDSNYMELMTDSVVLLNSLSNGLKVVKNEIGTVVISATVTGEKTINLNEELIKLTFKSKNKSGEGKISFGEVKIANTNISEYISGINTSSELGVDFSSEVITENNIVFSEIGTVSKTSDFNVTVSGLNFENNISGIKATINYNPSYMTFNQGSLVLLNSFNGELSFIDDSEYGKIKVVIAKNEAGFLPNQELFRLSFKGKGNTGNSNISFNEVEMTKADGMSFFTGINATDVKTISFQ